MASTYTAAGIELIAQGEQAGAWGDTTNTNWALVEEMIGGVVDISLTGSTYSLSTTDGATSEGRHSVLNFSGSPGATCTVTVTPNDMQKVYFVVNGSDQTVTISQGSGANVSVSAGKNKIVFCDGAGAGAAVTDISSGFDATTLAELGVTASAAELNILNGATLDVTELNYVDGVTSSIQTQLDAMVEKAGDTMTGALTLSGAPTANLHAATKAYVDETAQGIVTRPSAEAATTANLSGTYNNGTAGVGATLTFSAAASFSVDGVTFDTQYQGLLIKDQTNAEENGRYYLSQVGDGGTTWIFTRCGYCDTADEIPGSYIFVTGGSTNANTGWIQSVADPATFVVGTDDITVIQFSGAGTYTAGSGLDLTGTVFSHTDTSSQASVNNSGNTFIQDVTVDGFGHVTGLTSAAVSINNGTLTMATSGTGLSGSATFTANSATSPTFTVTSNATSANTGSTIVARDASGNFTAGTITAALSGNATTSSSCSGNAATATTLQTARTIGGVSFNGSANINLPGVNTAGNQNTSGNAATATAWATGRTLTLSGDVSGTSSTIDGTGNITLTATVANDSHTHDGRYFTETESDARYCLESNNLSDLTNAATARSNLGLGSLATLSTVNAATITDNSVGAAELNVSGNGTTAQFLRSDGDGTFTWATPTDTNTTYSAGAGLDLSGTTFSLESDARGDLFYMGRDTNDYIGVETTQINFVLDGNTDMRLYNNGDLHADGNVIAYSTSISDERLKEDIVGIDDALNKVCSLSGYTFKYKADGKVSAGVIAQEVEKVLPEAVTETELLKVDDGNEYKVVNYDALHGLLIEAIKELKAEVAELKAKVG